MSYQKFVDLGADVVNGHVFLNRKLVGVCGPTGFVLTNDGEAALQIEDVEFKEIPAAPAKPAAKAAKPKAPAAPVPGPNDDLLGDLDNLTA